MCQALSFSSMAVLPKSNQTPPTVTEVGGFGKTMNNTSTQKKKVLVTGASGLLGVATTEKFLSAGWEVIGVSRRKPELPSGRDVEFLSVDLRDKEKARFAFEPLTDITHIAYTAIHEKPDLVAGWSSKDQIETNNAMLHNVVEAIVRAASNFQHISILQGTKVYGVHLHPIPIPARERDARGTIRTSSSITKTMCVRWALSTASGTPHYVLNSSRALRLAR